jgi:hypothetical protein
VRAFRAHSLERAGRHSQNAHFGARYDTTLATIALRDKKFLDGQVLGSANFVRNGKLLELLQAVMSAQLCGAQW